MFSLNLMSEEKYAVTLLVARISPVVPEAAVPTPREPNCGVPVVPVISANVQETSADPLTDFPVAPIVRVRPVVHVAALVALVAVVADVALVAVEALPFRVAVIVPALKFPEPSRATIAFAVFALVAVVAELGMLVEAVMFPVPLPYT